MPVIVTTVPTEPLFGLKLDIVGDAARTAGMRHSIDKPAQSEIARRNEDDTTSHEVRPVTDIIVSPSPGPTWRKSALQLCETRHMCVPTRDSVQRHARYQSVVTERKHAK